MSATPAKKAYQIVVGYDFSELSERAVAEALDMARFRAPAELHVVTVAQQAGTNLGLPGQTEALTEETKYFVECVSKSKRPFNDGVAGLKVVKMLEAADKSLRQGGKAVRI